jgi:Undecaprenyl-phosphate galactose phosphotransferase WbaP
MTIIDNRRNISAIFIIISDVCAIFVTILFNYELYDSTAAYGNIKINLLIYMFVFTMVFISICKNVFNHYFERSSEYDEAINIFYCIFFIGSLSMSFIYAFSLSSSPDKHIYFFFFLPLVVLLFRQIIRILLNSINLWMIPTVVISMEGEKEHVVAALLSQFNLGLNISNIIQIKIIDLEDNLFSEKLLESLTISCQKISNPEIVLALHDMPSQLINFIENYLLQNRIKYHIIPDIGIGSINSSHVSHFFKSELLILTPIIPLTKAINQIIKRLFDIIFSLIALMFLFPLLCVIFYLIKYTDAESHPIYSHLRYGKSGKTFYCYKFRTMHKDSEMLLNNYLSQNIDARNEWSKDHKLKNDPRITRLGKFLRKYSLDELPQLLNVLVGDMSIVGPRPITQVEVSKYGSNIYYYELIQPGLTGLWQISGRNLTTYGERIALDLWYIKNWSFFYDIAIIIRTVYVVLTVKGAY